MVQQRWTIAALILGLTGGWMACGSDGGDGSRISIPGNPNRLVSELSQAEIQGACEEMSRGLSRTMDNKAMCAIMASMAALPGEWGGESEGDPVAACESVYQMCLANPEMAAAMADEWETELDCDDAEPLVDCNATVKEMEDCVNSMMALMRSAVGNFSCTRVAEFAAALDVLDNPNTPECKVVETKCPDFFDDDDDDWDW